jgi:oleate hydratase
VYTLCNVDRGVPEVWASVYDVRDLLYATSKLLDGKKPLEFIMPTIAPFLSLGKELLTNNVVADLLKKYNIV